MGSGDNNFVGIGLGGGDVIRTVSADLEQLDFTAVSSTFSVDGVGTNPDSTVLIKPAGSVATLAAGGSGVYTLTPDVAGVYGVQGIFGTEVITRVVRIGMEYGSCWAEQVFDIDLVAEGTSNPQDLSGGGVKTIDGTSFTCTPNGTLTTYATNGNGLEVTDDAGAGTTYAETGYDHSGDLNPGDRAIYVIEMGYVATNDNGDRIRFMQTDAATGEGTPRHSLWVDRNAANDYQWGIEDGAGVPNDGQIATSMPATLRFVQVYDGQVCYHYADTTATAVGRPEDVTFRGTTATRIITDNKYAGSRPDPWATSDWMQIIPVIQNSNASFYITRIALYIVRGDA